MKLNLWQSYLQITCIETRCKHQKRLTWFSLNTLAGVGSSPLAIPLGQHFILQANWYPCRDFSFSWPNLQLPKILKEGQCHSLMGKGRCWLLGAVFLAFSLSKKRCRSQYRWLPSLINSGLPESSLWLPAQVSYFVTPHCTLCLKPDWATSFLARPRPVSISVSLQTVFPVPVLLCPLVAVLTLQHSALALPLPQSLCSL